MVDASTSTKFDLRIKTTNDGSYFFAGAFLGALLNIRTGKLDVFQIINTNVTKSIDEITEKAGLGVGHETIEAYLIGSYMTENNIQSTKPSTLIIPNPIFEEAHKGAKKFGVGQESFFEVQEGLFSGESGIFARRKQYRINTSIGKYIPFGN